MSNASLRGIDRVNQPITHFFSNGEYGRQWCHGKGERDDAGVYDAQIGRAMNLEVGRDDTLTMKGKTQT